MNWVDEVAQKLENKERSTSDGEGGDERTQGEMMQEKTTAKSVVLSLHFSLPPHVCLSRTGPVYNIDL